jgi:Ca2+ transporting ATPase
LEPAVILVILICNATVGVLQESNAEAAIAKLKKREAAKAHVIRDGVNTQVDAVELVPGDIVVITVGDRVPADIRVLEPPNVSLTSDESPLTGESEPVIKHGDVVTGFSDAVAQDKRNILFSVSGTTPQSASMQTRRIRSRSQLMI